MKQRKYKTNEFPENTNVRVELIDGVPLTEVVRPREKSQADLRGSGVNSIRLASEGRTNMTGYDGHGTSTNPETINIALSSDKNSFLSKSFSFNKTLQGEAFSVLEKPKNKLISYGIFLIVILLGVGFIIISNFRKSKSKDEDYE